MKIRSTAFAFSLLIFGTPLISGCSALRNFVSEQVWLSRINGTYSGILESDGSPVDAETTFNYFGKKPFRGSFLYAESGNLVKGSLANCSPMDQRYLSCIWSDKYGSGSLNIYFTEDLNSFKGHWSPSSNPSEIYSWEGSR